MTIEERAKEDVTLNRAFEDESVFRASEKDLQFYLKILCREPVPIEWVRHREIIRGLTINNLMMAHVYGG
jgi:hypothetical protein